MHRIALVAGVEVHIHEAERGQMMRTQDRIEEAHQYAVLYDPYDDRWQTFRYGRLMYTAPSLNAALGFLREQLGDH